MPIVQVESDTIFKAFLLNSLAQAFIICFALVIKDLLLPYVSSQKSLVGEQYTWKMLLTFFVTFAAAMCVFYMLYATFGFGKSMLDPIAPTF
jgi:hypothetical protein